MQNDVRRAREAAGLTQQALADACGVTRQAVNTLEAGRYVPSTMLALRIARTVHRRVDELFWLDEEEAAEEAWLARPADPSRATPAAPRRVAVARVAGRLVAHLLPAEAHPSGNALLEAGPVPHGEGVVRVSPLVAPEALAGTLLVAGCAPALAALSDRLPERAPGTFLEWIDATSAHALELLRRDLVHVAGLHLLDETTGDFNVPIVAERFPDRRMLCVTLARWEQGLLVSAGNPLAIHDASDLVRPGIRVALREEGAGAHKLLLRLLRGSGIERPLVGSAALARGHFDVARQIASGMADVGVAIRSAALAFGLDFLPLAEERFDLVVPADLAEDRRVVRLLDVLSGRSFRRELTSVGGYDATETGNTVIVGGER